MALALSDERILNCLNEQQRRWYVALEFKKIGHGGEALLSLITGMNVETIRRGRRELDEELASRPAEGVHQEGGGRLPVEKKPIDPEGARGASRGRNSRRSNE